MNKFHVWSILFFLPSLAFALYLHLYIPALILSGVIATSFIFHLSKEKRWPRIDKFFAWALIVSNLVLIVLSGFRYPYAWAAFAVVPIALVFYYSSGNTSYDHKHGWWHFASSVITLFSLFTFLN